MASRRRPNQFHVHLSDEEQRWLYALSERAGMSASDWVRGQIRGGVRLYELVKPSSKQPRWFSTGDNRLIVRPRKKAKKKGRKR